MKADVLVFFGATGDLARRKIYPALHAMVRKGELDVPIIGVSRPRELEVFRNMVRESLGRSGDNDQEATDKLLSLLRFVGGSYDDEATFAALSREISGFQSPLVYLAIPPSAFGEVGVQLARHGWAAKTRIIVEKPFGRDLASAIELDGELHRYFPESAIYRIDHYLGKEPVQNLIYFHLANSIVDGSFHRNFVERVEITMAETLGMEGRGRFYEEVGAIRDVVQNHMLQVIACLAMECPVRLENEELRQEKTRVIKAVRPLRPEDVVRGQYRGYRQEPGVEPVSSVETFAALRLYIDNDRWDGVPFFIRVGKRLPVGCTEITVKYKRPLWGKIMEGADPRCGNYLRLRLSPTVEIAQGTRVKVPGTALVGQCVELLAKYSPPDEMLPYERLFHDAMAGNAELFASEEMGLAQWRVVDGVLGARTALHFYEPGTWGPSEAAALLAPHHWNDPVIEEPRRSL